MCSCKIYSLWFRCLSTVTSCVFAAGSRVALPNHGLVGVVLPVRFTTHIISPSLQAFRKSAINGPQKFCTDRARNWYDLTWNICLKLAKCWLVYALADILCAFCTYNCAVYRNNSYYVSHPDVLQIFMEQSPQVYIHVHVCMYVQCM